MKEKKRTQGGRILTEVIFTPWCDECGEGLGKGSNSRRAAEQTLRNHLKKYRHPNKQHKVLIVSLENTSASV